MFQSLIVPISDRRRVIDDIDFSIFATRADHEVLRFYPAVDKIFEMIILEN